MNILTHEEYNKLKSKKERESLPVVTETKQERTLSPDVPKAPKINFKLYYHEYDQDFQQALKIGENIYAFVCKDGIVNTTESILADYLKAHGWILLEVKEVLK